MMAWLELLAVIILTGYNDGDVEIKCAISFFIWWIHFTWKFEDKEVSIQDVFEAVGEFNSNKIDEKRLCALEKVACPSAGSCGGQFTANTMACVLRL